MNQGHEGEYFFAFDIETVPDVEAGPAAPRARGAR